MSRCRCQADLHLACLAPAACHPPPVGGVSSAPLGLIFSSFFFLILIIELYHLLLCAEWRRLEKAAGAETHRYGQLLPLLHFPLPKNMHSGALFGAGAPLFADAAEEEAEVSAALRWSGPRMVKSQRAPNFFDLSQFADGYLQGGGREGAKRSETAEAAAKRGKGGRRQWQGTAAKENTGRWPKTRRDGRQNSSEVWRGAAAAGAHGGRRSRASGRETMSPKPSNCTGHRRAHVTRQTQRLCLKAVKTQGKGNFHAAEKQGSTQGQGGTYASRQ